MSIAALTTVKRIPAGRTVRYSPRHSERRIKIIHLRRLIPVLPRKPENCNHIKTDHKVAFRANLRGPLLSVNKMLFNNLIKKYL